MVIFLYGPDSFRSKKKLDEIIDGYKKTKKSGLNLIYINVQEKDFPDFYDNFKLSSMFSETKLVILKKVFSNKKFQEDFLEKTKDIESLKDVVVIYEDGTVDERTKLFKILKKEHKSQEFQLLDGKHLKLWAQKEFETMRQKIHPVKSTEGGVAPLAQQFNRINADALDLILNYVGNDLWRLSNEIKKISDYKKGLVVKKEDVELLVRPRVEVDIFKTIDALALKNKKQALLLLKKHLDEGDNAMYLLSMVTYQFRNLLLIKELAGKGLMYSSIVKKSGLHPFVVKKNYFACSKFSFEELKSIYQKIFQIDLDIKTGKIEQETALDLLVSQI